jgi:import inner membrane translocase subunit TIM54
MATPNATPEPPISSKLAGVRTVLQYSGIPVGWLNKRPKLPSRNWLIFLSVTSTVTGYYIYDRRECKRIRQHYIDLVKDQSEETVRALESPRRITVYGSKWPGDDDYDQAMRYFRKYVKVSLLLTSPFYYGTHVYVFVRAIAHSRRCGRRL